MFFEIFTENIVSFIDFCNAILSYSTSSKKKTVTVENSRVAENSGTQNSKGEKNEKYFG